MAYIERNKPWRAINNNGADISLRFKRENGGTFCACHSDHLCSLVITTATPIAGGELCRVGVTGYKGPGADFSAPTQPTIIWV
ncbi:hypothetical protein EMH16_07615 [Klebsiella pneumoniae]|nr:hypothetical protein FNH10_26110 [Raoultella ornithinolytica]MBL2999346.1 hypothetical protein [Klebsiella pneumoniae]MBZ6901711.1 hypothetical protein [Klebsiella pneumoniae]TMY46248.1 hypothetical protein EMH16_07615 [Klebsiella pneumoniae]HBY9470103.1 hypothetical protein [Klebsiella pneumoniae]